jgi:uncharacterized RDD family membrane protein YckC
MSTPYGPADGAPDDDSGDDAPQRPIVDAQRHPEPDKRTPAIAGVGARSAAFALDAAGTVAVTFATSVTLVVVAFFSGYNSTSGFTGSSAVLANLGTESRTLIPLGAGLLYAVLTSRRGSSIGHRMMGLQVVDMETRTLVPLGRGLVRTLVLFGPLSLPLAQLPLFLLLQLAAGPTVAYSVAYGAWVPIAVIAGMLWWIALLIQASTGRLPLHDRAAGTMVLQWKVRPAPPQG